MKITRRLFYFQEKKENSIFLTTTTTTTTTTTKKRRIIGRSSRNGAVDWRRRDGGDKNATRNIPFFFWLFFGFFNVVGSLLPRAHHHLVLPSPKWKTSWSFLRPVSSSSSSSSSSFEKSLRFVCVCYEPTMGESLNK